jgi:esterase/lipase superfamily enzyme
MTSLARSLLAALVIVAAVGCKQRELIPTPNLYTDVVTDPFIDVPPEFQTTTVDLLFMTDRTRAEKEGEPVRYDHGRSRSLAFGSLVVEIGEDLTWEQLVEASTVRKRTVKLPLTVQSTTEQMRSPDMPYPIMLVDDVLRPTPEAVADFDVFMDAFDAEVDRRLALTPRKEAFVFIHGFNNSFDVAGFRLAELWHFLGREGVPILYSWPAGNPGSLRAYTADRESGEFTQYHLKEFLGLLSEHPGIEKIHIVAHSRGTDVAMTAIRELVIDAKARVDDPREILKFGNVVLAAPDIDDEVANQRFVADLIMNGMEQLTIYVTKKDSALGLAEWLFSNPDRVGRARAEDMSAYWQEFGHLFRTDTIDARVKTDFLGHGYFLSNPATFSDLILVLRYGARPGAENGRPLTEIVPTYYILNDDYPMQAAPMPDS